MIEMPSAPEVFNSRTGPEGTTAAGHGVRRTKKQLSFFPLYTLNMTAFFPDKPSNAMNIYCKAIKSTEQILRLVSPTPLCLIFLTPNGLN